MMKLEIFANGLSANLIPARGLKHFLVTVRVSAKRFLSANLIPARGLKPFFNTKLFNKLLLSANLIPARGLKPVSNT